MRARIDVTVRTPRGQCKLRIGTDDTVEAVVLCAKRLTGCSGEPGAELRANGIRLDTIGAVRAAARRGPIDLVMGTK